MEKLSDAELRAKTDEFRAARCRAAGARSRRRRRTVRRQRAGARSERAAARKEALEEVLPEAFAVVREAARRTLNMRHFDVQMIGGIALHNGKIAEMRTGEGKTLVATLPAYLNALAGAGRAHRHRQRLPRAARRGLDGQDLPLPRPDRGREPARSMEHDPKQARAYACRHHLRHQQRVRLRLPARQHGVPPLGEGAAARSTTRSSTRWTRS